MCTVAPPERRRHFRLRFPKAEIPIFDSTHGMLRILEAAEEGLRVDSTHVGAVGEIVTGQVRFADGHTIDVQASVFRVDRGATVLHKVHGIAMSDMMREQRRLLKKYAATDFLMAPRSY